MVLGLVASVLVWCRELLVWCGAFAGCRCFRLRLLPSWCEPLRAPLGEVEEVEVEVRFPVLWRLLAAATPCTCWELVTGWCGFWLGPRPA